VTLRRMACSRPGLTLLEVLVALAIFLMSLAAISQLVTSAGKRALDARRKDETARLARSKYAEVYAGVVPLQSASDTPFDEDPDYTWSLTADSATMTGLWSISVTVKRKGDDGPGFTLQEMMLDPTIRGSTQDTVTIAGATSSSSSSGSSTNSAPKSTNSAPARPMAAMPAAGKSPAAAQPSSGARPGAGAPGPGMGASPVIGSSPGSSSSPR
jgi:general secretion pathway protein I